MPHFSIQAGNPRSLAKPSCEEDVWSLNTAIQSVFPRVTEDAILRWRGICIPLGYKYAISLMVDDVIHLSEELRGAPSGTFTNSWVIQEFACEWTFAWKDGVVVIGSEPRGGEGEWTHILTEVGPVEVEIEQFLAEWKLPFVFVHQALRKCGFDSTLEGMDELDAFLQSIEKLGYHYGG